MRYLAIVLSVLFVGWIMCSPITAYAKHGCPGTGHGSDPSGGHGNGHGDGDGDGDSGSGSSGGGNVGASGASDGIGGGGGDVDRSMMRFPECTVVEWWSNGFSCPEPMPYIPAE